MEYEKIGAEIGRLVEEKQKAYGDAYGRAGAVLALLYPEGISVPQLGSALLVVRVVDKLLRIAEGKKPTNDESPWKDIAGYGLVGYRLDCERLERRAARSGPPVRCGQRLAELRAEIEKYAIGDRPSSPPVSLLEEEMRLLANGDECSCMGACGHD